MKKRIAITIATIILLVTVLPICSCSKEELEIYSCGNAFYINQPNKTYTIKELGVTSNGNAFFVDGYFCSEELGDPYAIKDGWFNVGTVYLAKKSSFYDSTVHEFNLDNYNEPVINITEDMDYVRIYSSDENNKHCLYINIEPRELPLDLVLENVQIYTDYGIPVIFSQTYQDINLILKGKNKLSAGVSYNFTYKSFQERVNDEISVMEEKFYNEYESAKDAINNFPDGVMSEGIVDHTYGHLINSADKALDAFENVLQGTIDMVAGVDGVKGFDGIACIVHAGGISVNGTGSLSVYGGDGSTGEDAASSLLGTADGGPGGNGAPALCCARYLSLDPVQVQLHGGEGGEGGDPSEGGFGIFGSSGDKGSKGRKGVDYSIASPRMMD